MIEVQNKHFLCLRSPGLYCSPRAAAIFFWRSSTPKRGDKRGKVSWKQNSVNIESFIFQHLSCGHGYYKYGHGSGKWGNMHHKLQKYTELQASCVCQNMLGVEKLNWDSGRTDHNQTFWTQKPDSQQEYQISNYLVWSIFHKLHLHSSLCLKRHLEKRRDKIYMVLGQYIIQSNQFMHLGQHHALQSRFNQNTFQTGLKK